MIRLDDTERTDPTWLEWRQKCTQAQATLNEAIATHDPLSDEPRPTASAKIYADLKEDHYAAKRAPFWGKCAYCEVNVRSTQHGDIDHFRPKGRVTDRETGKPLITRSGDEHPGYFWIAYDWRNLLLACGLCNRPNKRSVDERQMGKWDRFPLADETKRAESPGEELAEEPLLINPLVEDPSEHLDVTKEGVLRARDGSIRGSACIELLGLNERDLPDERAHAYQDTYRMFTELVVARLARHREKIAELEPQLVEISAGSRPHAISRRLAIMDAKLALQGLG